MSGGQQQQLAIGRALVGNPEILLLDEPSEGIQPSIVEEISRVLRRINQELGTTILFVEQNLDMIMALTRRCYVMDKGRIVAEMPSTELGDPRHRQAPPADLSGPRSKAAKSGCGGAPQGGHHELARDLDHEQARGGPGTRGQRPMS